MSSMAMFGGEGRARVAALRWGAVAVLAIAAAGCAAVAPELPYYWQSARGHVSLMQEARPIEELLSEASTDARLRQRLQRALEIREFAWRELGLPHNRSYTKYADVGRPFVVWNVFAAPELSMQLKQWCFPVAGCVSYRGYYAREDAERYAADLRERGWEVHLGGVPAYSTLGWFADPVLSTFIHYPEGELARLIFHELAHQVVYLKGDSTFNESFATAVEEAGVERWLAARADPELESAYRRFAQRRRDFVALLARHKAMLQAVYEAPGASEDDKRRGKAEVFASLRAQYGELKASWGGFAGYDRWFGTQLTNAHLASVGTYHELVPGFRALLAEQGGDLPRFYEAVRALARLDKSERDRRLGAPGAGAVAVR
jgi:predicted aminopeptidase